MKTVIYVGAKPMTALEEAITDWNGGYDEEGAYTGAGEYDADGNYVGPKPTPGISGCGCRRI